MGEPAGIKWMAPDTFEIGGERFQLWDGTTTGPIVSTRDCFALGKNRQMVERFYDRNANSAIRRVLDLGIFQGGSVVFAWQVCHPERLVALELDTKRVEPLDAFIADHGLEDRIRLNYGTDQADRGALTRIVETEFDGPLDLVVDDASHFYDLTRASFEALFPFVREGGLYVIEDWDWAHYPGDYWQKDLGPFGGRPALTNLVIEILMLAGTCPEIVAEVNVTRGLTEVVRGPASIHAPIRLEELYANRGLQFRPLL